MFKAELYDSPCFVDGTEAFFQQGILLVLTGGTGTVEPKESTFPSEM